MNILVTGGAGYIGREVCHVLSAEHDITVLDNLSRSGVLFVPYRNYTGNISDRELVSYILLTHKIELVIHLAAYAIVPESNNYPRAYYNNNVSDTITLLDTMLECNVKKIMFSSTGQADIPTNVYARTKKIIEECITTYATVYGLEYVIFRFFNACGNTPNTSEGFNAKYRIIPSIVEAAKNQLPFTVYGTDWPTPDGTCVRDFIHVSDIAQAHRLGLNASNDIYELGNNTPYSINQIILAVERIFGKSIDVITAPRRDGDPAISVGLDLKARNWLGWHPRYGLDAIIKSMV